MIRFFRGIYRDNRLRTEQRRHFGKDLGLYALNRLLQPREALLLRRYPGGGFPIAFIVGVPRSGTTLLHQLIAACLPVGFITNRVARYWMAPLWATRRFFPRGSRPQLDLTSSLGATRGQHSPHEFTYFWQFHLELDSCDVLSGAAAPRWVTIRRELRGLADHHRSPVVFKNLTHIDLNIGELAANVPEARFLYLRREPQFAAQSILGARRQRYGDERVWWSVRPLGFRAWLDRDPLEQVAYQVVETRACIEAALSHLPRDRWCEDSYESLVRDPAGALRRLADFLALSPRADCALPALSGAGNVIKIEPQRFATLSRLVEEFGK